MGKSIKHHLIGNRETGKTVCGINFKSDSIRIAIEEDGNWYDDYSNSIDIDNWESVFCLNCLKLHEMDLINQFKQRTFLIQYELALPKTKRAMQLKKAKSKRNRINKIKTKSIKTNKPIESKPKVNPIPKSAKGIERDKKKQLNKTKSKPIDKPTESKCRIISKPIENKPIENKPIENKPIELVNEVKPLIDLSNGPVTIETIDVEPIENKPIELVNEVKPLIDLSNGPVTIETFEEVIETIDPNEEWSIGDPIDDDTIFELSIGSDWKLVRHDKQLDKWQFQSKQVVKGLPKWIADSEWIDYKDASELIIDGYCE